MNRHHPLLVKNLALQVQTFISFLGLVREMKNFLSVTSDVSEDVGRGFQILIKKQITELVRKLRDESNDTN
jgi:hypothetical protein